MASRCEALTAGRATEALLRTMWGEELESNDTFDRVIYLRISSIATKGGVSYGDSTVRTALEGILHKRKEE